MLNNNSKVGTEVSQSTESDVTTSYQTIAKSNVIRIAGMITEQFVYRGFTFQRMSKDARWYVCYGNEIVNHGQYQNELKEWVDGHFALRIQRRN